MFQPRSADEIVEQYRIRLNTVSPMFTAMRDMAKAYDNDFVIPLAEMDREAKAAIPNLIKDGIEQYAMRTSSVLPAVTVEPLGPGTMARKSAVSRRRAIAGFWEQNRMKRLIQRRSRFLYAYAATPVLMFPDFAKLNGPQWRIVNPLQCLPARCDDPDDFSPRDCIVSSTRSGAWLMENHLDMAHQLFAGKLKKDMEVEVLLYVDADQISTVLVGPGGTQNENLPVAWNSHIARGGAMLSSVANRVGRCLVTYPTQVSLTTPISRFAGMTGIYEAAAELEAIQRIAARKAVLSEEWLVGRNNETPRILQVADPMQGQVGMVMGADLVNRQVDPQFSTNQQLDRMERNMRVEGGIPSDFGGEAGTNVRTGRRGSQLLGAVLDFPIAEAMDTLQHSLQLENALAIDIDKAYWGSTTRSVVIDWPGPGKGTLEYKPTELWVSNQNRVAYPMAGVDAQGLVIALAQRVGSGTMSLRTAMELDPLVEDPEAEHDMIFSERLESALFDTFVAEATNPENPRYSTTDVAKLMGWVRSDRLELADAIIKLQKEQIKAAEAEQGSPQSQQGLGTPPPELSPVISGPDQDVMNLNASLSALRRPQALATPGEAVFSG